VSTWSEREKKLNITLQCAATEHVAAASRINNDVKACACFSFHLHCTAPVFLHRHRLQHHHRIVLCPSVTQQKRKLMKDLAVFVGQSAVKEGHKLVDVHRDDVDMSFLQTTAKAAQVSEPPLSLHSSSLRQG
jgi:hypothetical protein